MDIITHRHRVESVEYRRAFHWADMPGAGFSFDVNEDGEVVTDNDAARANYELCLHGVDTDGRLIIDDGIEERHHSWIEPAVGICEVCSREVVLDRFTNACDCGADYNSSGQRLAPRSQWGEETGESLSDILRIP